MLTVPASRSLAGDLPLKFVGGEPSLDLVNTVDWADDGPERDRLPNYPRLLRWAEDAGLLSRSAAAGLRARAVARPEEAEAALREARRVRYVLWRRFTGLASGTGEDREAAAAFAGLLREAARAMRFERRKGGRRHRWVCPDAGERLDGLLHLVVWSAARLLESAEAERLRVCAGPDCGWVFVDRSRNGFRRWCEMQTCGTRQKTRLRRERAAGNAPAPP